MQVILLSRSIGPTWGLLVYHPIVSPSQCCNPDSQMLNGPGMFTYNSEIYGTW